MNDGTETTAGALLQVKKRSAWGSVPEALLEDTRLALDTRGAACWLAIRPDGWQIIVPVLLRRLGIGREKWQRIAGELEAGGYLTRTKFNNPESGKWQWLMAFDPQPEPPGCGFAGHGRADHGTAEDGGAVTGNDRYIGNNTLGGGGTKTKTTTTLTATELDEFVEAAVMMAATPPRNITKYRQAVRRRIASSGPTSDDFSDLDESRRRRHAANKQAIAVEAAHQRDTEAATPEAQAATLAVLEVESAKWKRMLGPKA